MNKGKYIFYYLFFGILMILLFGADLIFGSVNMSVRDLFGTDPGKEILLVFRLPKAIAALLSGIALSVCGLQMQTLFRNPLADPYILGVSSGSGLGVAIYLMGLSIAGYKMENTLIQSLGTAGAALAGAVAVTAVILYISRRVKSNLSLLIFGVMLGFIAGALVSLLQYASSAHALKAYVLWTMGSFAALTPLQLGILVLMIIAGMICCVMNIKNLNAILLGNEYATAVGLNVKKIRNNILVSTTLLVGAVTAFCGPIGFIGIAVPHIARFIFKDADHKVLVPAVVLLGGCLTLCADALAGVVSSGGVVPINTIAALFGIPVILAIILKRNL